MRELDLGGRLEQLKTAVAEATMNAIEHGNENRPELTVAVSVARFGVRASGCGSPTRAASGRSRRAETPDLEAKLAGLQKPRGWGLFLIENMVDELKVSSDEMEHTIELVLHLKGDGDAS